MKNFCCFFVCLFLIGVSATANNTELQNHVLKMAQLIPSQIQDLVSEENFENNRNELLTTLTENLITFINEKYPYAYDNPNFLKTPIKFGKSLHPHPIGTSFRRVDLHAAKAGVAMNF